MPDASTRRPVAVVIGASSGIGRCTARLLGHRGWDVVLASRSGPVLQEVARECTARGARALVVPVDVSDRLAVEDLFARAVDEFGAVAAVVHTAGAVAYGRFEDIPPEVFDRAVTTNVVGTANVARSALRLFRGQGGGSLVITGSLLGKIAVPSMSPYVTGKWAVHALTRMIQLESRALDGVHVTLVSPGSVNTPAYSQAANYTRREGRPPPPVDPPEKVARAIVRSLDRPRRERSVGLANHVVVLGFRLLPAVYDAAVGPLMSVFGLSRRPTPDHPGTVLAARPAGEAARGWWDRWGRRTVPTTAVSPAAGATASRPGAGRRRP
ncbi:SDR family NAD(P)-dependent oxidoreductase [Nakamurella sp.]|uniref:SDR family NAD(P)-dependent oxidoreductase n=1 Tax=Nakamurella sp. TaxID=1869182 RepID=UPI003B3B5ABD